jgi:hypothetical protein
MLVRMALKKETREQFQKTTGGKSNAKVVGFY